MSRITRNMLITGLVCALTVLLGGMANAQGLVKVGEEVALLTSAPHFEGATGDRFTALAWQEEISMAGASYIAVHFNYFNLPPGAELTVRTPDGAYSKTYTGYGKSDRLIAGGFWAMHMPGDVAIVELVSEGPIRQGSVAIDKFAHGYPDIRLKDLDGSKALCGTDDSEWAKCYQTSEPSIYNESKAVARLLINGSGACTGWLVGSEGHLITNEHCIGGASDALNTDYEFMAEGSSCTTSCASWLGCPGTVVADTATLIQVDAAYDYALVKLPTNPTGTYGYMQLRQSGAVVNERIYNPGHPQAWGKRIGVKSTHAQDQSGYCEVYSLCEPVCSGGSCDIGYYCDTQGGSSGSPILAYSDNCVVALHHCATCPNRGVPIEDVISDLGGNLPANALCSSGGNISPTASFTTSVTGLTVSFTDTSTDPDGTVVSWSWTFGDGGSSYSQNPTHTYTSAGTYTVQLTVTDNDGATGTTSVPVTVSTSGVTNLANGVPVTGVSGSVGTWKYYRILVPAGASNLVMQISGGTGDADLYTLYGFQPTSSTWDCRPYKYGNNESCTVASPSAGYYYLGLYAYAAYANVTVQASYSTSSCSLTNPTTLTNLSASQGNWLRYCIDVPAGASNLQFTISGGTGDADLYTLFGAEPSTTAYDCRPYLGGNSETCTYSAPAAGTYHVGIRAYATFSGVTLSVSHN